MASERMQRRIEALLDEADQATSADDWATVANKARAVLAIDEANADALDFLKMAAANGVGVEAPSATAPVSMVTAPPSDPDSFVGGRYRVLRFLGEGGKKRVFLAHDATLDRDVAFALIKTEGLDDTGRQRITREAQAMGRLGSNPNIVSIFDIGEEGGAPYVVTELMGGGDVEGLLEKAEGPLPIERTLEIAKDVTRGLVFAHTSQVVHRDLKPGNVWLTADGVAKIGDFGLAVALDRSRLTQHGFMVGTVNYMPPEQALGGEVTPQSDLYSLGAMLYEMVTGQPPFLGDDSTAIISQHINTPPVAPSWKSESCPPELEDLVLKLLAKAPQDRPSSAQEVLGLLEQVDPAAPSRRHTGSSANPLDRLARGVFVGREKELERLRSAFDDAFTGRGSVVMLVGEPGIGKTRTSQELETYARVRGAQVLWGRNHEGAGAPAFHPWVQVGRQWGAANDTSVLAPVLAADGSDLAVLFPELRQVVGFTEPPTIGDPAAAQFHLFESYTAFIRAASIARPLVLVLDDIHWADKPSLLLLQHLARELANMRVLIIGAYRDTELARTHPLSEALATLNRDGGFLRLPLKGLSRDEVAAYLEQRANAALPTELVSRIYEETEGNPFFLSEVVNLMADEGTLGEKQTKEVMLPDGVREALGRRLDRISEDANNLLRIAAVVGREFRYDTLEALNPGGSDKVLGLIEEGLDSRVIEEMERPGYYRFTHALMQETLLEELSTTRRVRLHGEVAEALETRWGASAMDNASRLARHYAESATLTPAHAEKAVLYLEAAARQSEASFAWDDAAEAYERILQLNRDTGNHGDRHAEGLMLARWARCLAAARHFGIAWRTFKRAFDIFDELGAEADYARVVAAAVTIIPDVSLPPEAASIVGLALDRASAAEPDVRGHLVLSSMAGAIADLDRSRYQTLAAELHAIVDATHSLYLEAALEVSEGWGIREFSLTDGSLTDRWEHAVAAVTRLEQGGFSGQAAQVVYVPAVRMFAGGHLDKAQELLTKQAACGTRAGLSLYATDGAAKLAGIRLFRGGSAITGSEAIHRSWLMDVYRSYERLIRIGDPAPLPDVALAGKIAWQAANILTQRIEFRALSGDIAGAVHDMKELDRLLPDAQPMYARRLRLARAYLSVRRLGEPATGVPSETYNPAERIMWTMLNPRMYGELALASGDFDLAKSSLTEALDWCIRERCPVEEGRVRQALAELAEKRGDHAAAVEQLDRAAELFQQYGAKLFLDQVLAKKKVLKA